jgi:FkbM family methyltransferase
LYKKIKYKTPRFLQLRGAKDLGSLINAGGGDNRIRIMKLLHNSNLGKKGTKIYVVKDIAIYESLKYLGDWSPNITKIVSEQIIRSPLVINFIDIGANIGLITMGVINQIQKDSNSKRIHFTLVEPLPDLAKCLELNLMQHDYKMELVSKPLTISGENVTLYREKNNSGSGTMFSSLGTISEFISFKLDSVKSCEFFDLNIKENEETIIKCDIQGYDAKVLSQIPNEKIKNISMIICELWSHPFIESNDVEKFLAKFVGQFKFYFLENSLLVEKNIVEIQDLWCDGKESFIKHKYGIVKDLVIIRNHQLDNQKFHS